MIYAQLFLSKIDLIRSSEYIYICYFLDFTMLLILSVISLRSIFLSILRYFPFLICTEEIHSGTSSNVKLIWASTSPETDKSLTIKPSA